jgi:shikimate dehydrogenase
MRSFGLIGYPLGHSFSKKYFTEKFFREGITDAHYELFPIMELDELAALRLQWPNLRGLNVTIPYKEAVLPYLDGLDETAQAVGAVNCISIENQQLIGYNTDVIGFEKSLLNFFPNDNLLIESYILGTGGAAKAVAFVLKKLGIPFQFVSRRQDDAAHVTYEQLSGEVARFKTKMPMSHLLFVNTTPLGTHPNVNTCPDLPFDRLSTEDLVFDLVYNPAETLLLRRAQTHGCCTQNGLEMLHLQAEAAWHIWNRPFTE